MKNNFQIIGIDDKFESGNGIGYVVGLINVSSKEFTQIGLEIDGDEYREDCWRAEFGIGDTDIGDLLSYVSEDGTVHELRSLDSDFKEEIIRVLNLDN